MKRDTRTATKKPKKVFLFEVRHAIFTSSLPTAFRSCKSLPDTWAILLTLPVPLHKYFVCYQLAVQMIDLLTSILHSNKASTAPVFVCLNGSNGPTCIYHQRNCFHPRTQLVFLCPLAKILTWLVNALIVGLNILPTQNNSKILKSFLTWLSYSTSNLFVDHCKNPLSDLISKFFFFSVFLFFFF